MNKVHYIGIAACAIIMALIVALAPYHSADMLSPDQGWDWYYWKLSTPDFWSRFSAWSLYAIHQTGFWFFILKARRERPKYTSKLHRINYRVLAWNLSFVLLHIAQTKLFYDGLAQDTSILSSQFSVIFMLVFILIMENERRGLWFGKTDPVVTKPAGFLRRYHGYYFSWAIVYTFWFHPIEDTLGHLLGTFYTLLLLLQGSLIFTVFHRNRFWTVLLEAFVLIHGAMVAYMTMQGDQWKMFLFGFLTLFVITQMHGIGLSVRARWGIVASYAVCVFLAYGTEWHRLTDLIKIPAIEFGVAYMVAAIAWLLYFLGLYSEKNKEKNSSETQSS